MLKSLWNSLVGTTDTQEATRPAGLDRAKLKMLVEHFPVGKKLHYYPEYQRDIVFSTLVVAYRVNEHYLYSQEAIYADSGGTPIFFSIGPEKKQLPLDKVTELCLLVPDTSDMERSLDYFRRANIGRGGQFMQGNAITLLGDKQGRGIPTLDTQVEKRVKLHDGPYADNTMILLRPDFTSLGIHDQRQRERMETMVPVSLFLGRDALRDDRPAFQCILGDFTDQSVRLRVQDRQRPMPAMEPNDIVTIVFSIGDPPRTYMIMGRLFRRADDDCVVNLEKLYRDGEFAKFKPMDLLEIKAGLLNYHS